MIQGIDSVFAGNSIKCLSKIHSENTFEKQTWSVCPHLSEPELVYDYYLSSGMLIIVLGHCFCESCLDMILSQDDLTELVSSGRKMTDRQFQRKFIEPLFSSNTKFTSSYKYQENNTDSQKTWITCSHLTSGTGLRNVYLNGGSDLNNVLNRVETAGGQVLLAKTEIGEEHGFFAFFLDSEGNKVGLHSMA